MRPRRVGVQGGGIHASQRYTNAPSDGPWDSAPCSPASTPALSLPPWGWWPLAFVGLALLYRVGEDAPWRRRLLLGWVAGLGHFGIGLFWMSEFTLPGGILATLFSATFVGAAAVLMPPAPGWRRAVAFPAALFLLEAIRVRWPFGGVPPGGLPLGQIGGPLGSVGAHRWSAAARRTRRARRSSRWPSAAGCAASFRRASRSVWRCSACWRPTAPRRASVDAGLVQGGGRRGFRAVDTDEHDVYEAHLEASEGLRGPLDLILWPEDVIHVDDNVARTPVAADLAALATRHRATLVAGVVEGEGTNRFRNAAVAWSPDGAFVGRYEKLHRVPFGEWVPFRSFVGHLRRPQRRARRRHRRHGPERARHAGRPARCRHLL